METKEQAWYGTGVGRLACELIKKRLPDHEVLELVLRKYEEAGTTIKSVQWYRSKLRSQDPNIPTNREVLQRRQSLVEGWGDPMDEGPASYEPNSDESARE